MTDIYLGIARVDTDFFIIGTKTKEKNTSPDNLFLFPWCFPSYSIAEDKLDFVNEYVYSWETAHKFRDLIMKVNTPADLDKWGKEFAQMKAEKKFKLFTGELTCTNINEGSL